MSFLFGKKSKSAGGSGGGSRDLDSRAGNHAAGTQPAAGDKHKSIANGSSTTGDVAMRAPPPIRDGTDSRKQSMDTSVCVALETAPEEY